MQKVHLHPELPLPVHYEPQKVGHVWRVAYARRAEEARAWAKTNDLQPSKQDTFKMAMALIDVQNTFCIPDFELFVAGRSGTGAVDDNIRLVEFIYRNLGTISHFILTLDTHLAAQIFHPIFLVDDKGENPPAYTLVSAQDISEGRWKFNDSLADDLGLSGNDGQSLLEYYTNQLAKETKYDLTIWPYHAMLGGIGHALVPAVEEAVFFHTIARYSHPDFEVKGDNPFTEHYSAIGPEVLQGPRGEDLAQKSDRLLRLVQGYDAVLLTGQAKSHCVAWTISDLLDQIMDTDSSLAGKVFLLEDCTSPVVVPGAIDYTDQAMADFARFAEAGIHVVRSTEPISSWPGIFSES